MTDEKVCSQCKGLRYRSFEHDLIRLPCKNCQGTGSQEVASILKEDDKYAEECDNGDDDNTFISETSTNNSIGVTSTNGSADEEVTGESELPKKRKARKKHGART